MIRSSVTVSLVAEARGGPFVFWDDLEAAFAKAAALGFDAIEIFPPGPDALDVSTVRQLMDKYHLAVAAVGTGAGWVKHKLHLCLPDGDSRTRARDFIRATIDFAGQLGAPAIIGSMQGRWGELTRDEAIGHVSSALDELGNHAQQYGVPLIYEPLNRYETNIACTVEAGLLLLKTLKTKNVKLLADLFHMNIEEVDIAAALRTGADSIGHVHFVDSTRRAAGLGHLDFAPIAAALHAIDYKGYASAEAFSYPAPDTAAWLTIQAFRRYFPRPG